MKHCTFVHNLEFGIEISPILCEWEGVKNVSSSTFQEHVLTLILTCHILLQPIELKYGIFIFIIMFI